MTTSSLPVPPPPAHVPLVPASELAHRAEDLAGRLRNVGLDGAFLLHPSSLFWIAGTLADGYPFVDGDGEVVLPLRTSVGRSGHESPLRQAATRRLGDLPGALQELGAKVEGRIGLELDVVPAAVLQRFQKIFPGTEFRDVSRTIREARSKKSAYEISWIEKAAEIVGASMDEALPSRIRPGVREIDLSAFLEGDLRARRHQGVIPLRRWNMQMHYGVMSAGASASFPCYFDGPDGLEGLYPAVQQGGGERVIETGVPILVDFVGAAGGYLADRTRIFCVGPPPPEAQEAHDFCLEMLEEITSRLRPDAIPSTIYEDVMSIAGTRPWRDRFMGWGENQVSFLGHGIGIDLDEFPVIAPRFEMPLEPGHVIAIEPKVFLGGAGGVGVENTYVITETGFRNLTVGSEKIRIVEPSV
jgi:Xaa-Pro aminopeptidase